MSFEFRDTPIYKLSKKFHKDVKYILKCQKSVILVLDEIQKIPNWSEHVKKEWDTDTRNKVAIKVVLLGSSSLLLQKGITESLAGRYELIRIPHWSFQEMHDAFGYNLDQYIYFGGYPGAAELITDEKRWKNYVRDALIEPAITKDILMLTRVDKPALLRQLFQLGTLYSGKILSYTKLLGQLHDAGNTTTLAHYLDLLTTAGLLGGLSKYSGKEIRTRSSSPKFQTYNTALFSALSQSSFSELLTAPELWGQYAESAVGAHLINNSLVHGYTLSYWKEGNYEVDFILHQGKKLVALEVKSGKKRESLSGLELFNTRFKPQKTLVVGQTLPIAEFLDMSPQELFD
ncbi:MAG: ATP-binding protein [Candidatus Margulisbacteria bacterium]|nr:ATP-binding protein [Candidatus Margulisiibacteriota bacterium]